MIFGVDLNAYSRPLTFGPLQDKQQILFGLTEYDLLLSGGDRGHNSAVGSRRSKTNQSSDQSPD